MAATWDEIRDFGRTLPDVQETTHDGRPSLSVAGHMFARLEPDDRSVIIMCSPWEKEVLLSSGDPSLGDTPRREDHDFVVLHLDNVDIDSDIQEMVTEAWRIAEGQASLD